MQDLLQASRHALPMLAATAVLFGTTTAVLAQSRGHVEKQSGVWIEGPGFDITYGADYDTCASRCLATPKCVMVEYYRPEKKCNQYDKVRPRLKGGESWVGIKTSK